MGKSLNVAHVAMSPASPYQPHCLSQLLGNVYLIITFTFHSKLIKFEPKYVVVSQSDAVMSAVSFIINGPYNNKVNKGMKYP